MKLQHAKFYAQQAGVVVWYDTALRLWTFQRGDAPVDYLPSAILKNMSMAQYQEFLSGVGGQQ